MQRLGFLKRLIKKISSTPTSNLSSVGNDLLGLLLNKNSVELTDDRIAYIKERLTDNAYSEIKKITNQWITNGGERPLVRLELQDLYLSDPKLPSQIGKLVKYDWQRYPVLGTNLGLIREGTYSANTRANSLLLFTSENEILAFNRYTPEINPLLISKKQSLLFLYSFLENDGEVLIPLWLSLIGTDFSDREAGDKLPEIYKKVFDRYRDKSLTIDQKQRFNTLEKTISTINKQKELSGYQGGSAREENIRVRLEPFVDIGIFCKSDPFRFDYSFSSPGKSLMNEFAIGMDSNDIDEFLFKQFMKSIAKAWGFFAISISSMSDVIPYVYKAWKAISSSSGYAPIEEIGLVAGINAVIDDKKIIEIETTKNVLLEYQKENPYIVRFTVDRMGNLAHVKFLKEPV